MGDVMRHIIEPMTALWGDLPSADPERALGSYVRQLEGYDDDVLERAFRRVEGEFRPTSWERVPVPSRFLEAARAVMPAAPASRTDGGDVPPPTPEARERVQRLMVEFRRAMANMNITEKPAKPVNWQRGQRPEFERMQRESPNRELHTVRRVGGR